MSATDPETQGYFDAVTKALAQSNTPAQRQKRERLAELTRQAEAIQAEAQDLQAAITEADKAVSDAERALGAHLQVKHGLAKAAQAQTAFVLPDLPSLDGTPCDDLLDGSITEDASGRYEAVGGIWVRIPGEAA